MTCRAFVTGAAGFIGSHLCERLLAEGYGVVGYDNFDAYYTGKERNLAKCLADGNFRLCRGDVLDIDALRKSMVQSDIVFHLAAQPGVRFSSDNPWKTTSTNITGTLNTLVAARNQGVKKIVFASSSSVYGIPDRLPCSETLPLRPLSVYGASKLAGEEYCRALSRLWNIPVTILRYHTVYGPRQRPDMAIRKFVTALLNNEPITIYGDGAQTRDFTYVADAVTATFLASEKGDNETFNIGRGESVTVSEMVSLLTGVCGHSPKLVVHEPRRTDDAPDTLADITKANRILGYAPKVRLKEGLAQFVKWYKHEIAASS